MGLIEKLYAGCSGYLELRAIAPGKPPKRHFLEPFDGKGIKGFVAEHGGVYNIYLGVATRDGAGGGKENIVNIPAIWCDLDFNKQEQVVCDQKLSAFPMPPTVKIESGGGYHVYWIFREPCDKTDIPRVEATLKALCIKLGGDMDSTDASRILRLPRTMNRKYAPPRAVKIVYENGAKYNLGDFDDFLDIHITEPTSPSSLAGVDNGALDRIMGCAFMQHCRDDATTLPEPEWYAMISQLCREKGGPDLIHELSKPYAKGRKERYNPNATDKKIIHALNSGPITCDKISELWKCGRECPVRSPAALVYQKCEQDETNKTFETNETFDEIETSETRSNKIETRLKHDETSAPGTLADKVREWLEETDGVFHYNDLARDLQLKSTKSIRPILSRFVKDKTLERIGVKAGTYRVVQSEADIIEWWSTSGEEFEVNLPLGIGNFAKLHPGNIVVIAGESNSAKTALLLEIARLNLANHKIRYQSSEMGAQELSERLTLYGQVMDLDAWHKVDFRKRSADFHDLIIPDALNIIDFLEVHDEFWKVGGTIRAIHDSLTTGTCFIALQKKPGADVGKGGYVSLEKPRLYLSVGFEQSPGAAPHNIIKVIKCKNYRDKEQNPNGLKRRFKLYSGWDINPLGDWYYD